MGVSVGASLCFAWLADFSVKLVSERSGETSADINMHESGPPTYL